MKKLTIGCVAAFAASAGFAQSSVKLSGLVDATIAYGKGTGPAAASRSQLTNSGNGSSRLMFTGNEDLGGGLSASFWLEAGLTPDDGRGAATSTNNQITGAGTPSGLTFNRRSTVSLAGIWGEVRAGRDYTTTFWNSVIFDPFNNLGVGTSQILGSTIGGPSWVRVSNSISYLTPSTFGGFYGQIQHFLGENSSGTPTEDDGTGTGIRVGYASGPINVAIAHGRTDFTTGDITTSTIGASYQFTFAKLSTQFYRDRIAAGATGKGWLLGATIPVDGNEVRASYSRYENNTGAHPETRKLALGYVQNLSKRTALYVTFAKVRNGGGASQALVNAVTSANGGSTGYNFGLRHLF